MSKNQMRSKGLRMVKAFLTAFIVFFILILITGILIRFTPLPERRINIYAITSLSLACFFLGLSMGRILEKRGIIYGALSSVIFVLLIIMVAVLITGTFSEAGIIKIAYLPCVILGCIGGMTGVNLKE